METEVNVGETPGKIVGRRRICDPFDFGMELQKAGASMIRTNGLPKGTFKFNSHEEADRWILDQQAKHAAGKGS